MEDQKRHNINIQNYLPHRKPMLMVDEILEIDPQEVLTTFIIQSDNIFVEDDHFSEVGLIENIAQTCSSIVGQDFFNDIRDSKDIKTKVIGFITNIKKVSVHHLPKVGSEIISRATLISQFGEICTISCKTYHKELLLVEAEISLLIKAL